MRPFYEVIKRPLLTEKAVLMKENFNRYSFEVDLHATKPSISEAIESHFKVNVEEIRTLVLRGKFRKIGRYTGRRSNWKKAIVTLKEGQKIEVFEAK